MCVDDVFERLERVLERYADENAAYVFDISELDGFFHALGCSPALVPPSVWLSALWGGEAFVPAWPDEASLRQYMADVMAHYNSVMGMLADDECAPVFLYGEFEGKETMIVDHWCEGFLLGMALWPEGAAEPPDELLEPILFFTVDLDNPNDEHRQLRDNTSAEEIELLQALVPESVFGLRAYYGLNRRPALSPSPSRRASTPPRGKSGKAGKPSNKKKR